MNGVNNRPVWVSIEAHAALRELATARGLSMRLVVDEALVRAGLLLPREAEPEPTMAAAPAPHAPAPAATPAPEPRPQPASEVTASEHPLEDVLLKPRRRVVIGNEDFYPVTILDGADAPAQSGRAPALVDATVAPRLPVANVVLL